MKRTGLLFPGDSSITGERGACVPQTTIYIYMYENDNTGVEKQNKYRGKKMKSLSSGMA